jgi:cell division protein ZapA (FtsZ GTPase activity inhibitor)
MIAYSICCVRAYIIINTILMQVIALVKKNKQVQTDIELNEVKTELSADDLAIIAAGLNVISDLFAFYSLIKEREETEQQKHNKQP